MGWLTYPVLRRVMAAWDPSESALAFWMRSSPATELGEGFHHWAAIVANIGPVPLRPAEVQAQPIRFEMSGGVTIDGVDGALLNGSTLPDVVPVRGHGSIGGFDIKPFALAPTDYVRVFGVANHLPSGEWVFGGEPGLRASEANHRLRLVQGWGFRLLSLLLFVGVVVVSGAWRWTTQFWLSIGSPVAGGVVMEAFLGLVVGLAVRNPVVLGVGRLVVALRSDLRA